MKNIFKIIITFALILILISTYVYSLVFTKIRSQETFFVQNGDSLIEIATNLENENIIKSKSVFKILFLIINGKDKILASGEYYFDNSYNVLDVVKKFSNSVADKAGTSLTVPEGWTNQDVAARVSKIFEIDRSEFLEKAKNYNGRLFPETYFFDKSAKTEDIIKKMSSEFIKRVGEISDEDLILASIVEGEAKYKDDMRIVSGILQERIKINMPLQVDVAMETYKKTGLPNSPINNPGLNAIEAVRNPIKTDYLYYITGNDGNMYYSKTYEEHKQNIQKYLK